MRIISESEFSYNLKIKLSGIDAGIVTGPGRSGAIAAVYASHFLRIPFVPFGQLPPIKLGRILLIDTAIESGKTLRKSERKYKEYNPISVAIYEEPPRVAFWYESEKPQRYKHEEIL